MSSRSSAAYGTLALRAADLAKELDKLKNITVSGIPRSLILDRIESHLHSVETWAMSQAFGRANEYALRAETLIELLEIKDCGSTGGFDKGQKRPRNGLNGLNDRYNWLKGKK